MYGHRDPALGSFVAAAAMAVVVVVAVAAAAVVVVVLLGYLRLGLHTAAPAAAKH